MQTLHVYNGTTCCKYLVDTNVGNAWQGFANRYKPNVFMYRGTVYRMIAALGECEGGTHADAEIANRGVDRSATTIVVGSQTPPVGSLRRSEILRAIRFGASDQQLTTLYLRFIRADIDEYLRPDFSQNAYFRLASQFDDALQRFAHATAVVKLADSVGIPLMNSLPMNVDPRKKAVDVQIESYNDLIDLLLAPDQAVRRQRLDRPRLPQAVPRRPPASPATGPPSTPAAPPRGPPTVQPSPPPAEQAPPTGAGDDDDDDRDPSTLFADDDDDDEIVGAADEEPPATPVAGTGGINPTASQFAAFGDEIADDNQRRAPLRLLVRIDPRWQATFDTLVDEIRLFTGAKLLGSMRFEEREVERAKRLKQHMLRTLGTAAGMRSTAAASEAVGEVLALFRAVRGYMGISVVPRMELVQSFDYEVRKVGQRLEEEVEEARKTSFSIPILYA